MSKIRIIFYINLFISISVCIAIFLFSSQNGTESGRVSEGLTRKLFASFVADEVIYFVEQIARKIAHFTVYFVLGISSFFTYRSYKTGFTSDIPKKWKTIIVPLLFCFFYSVTDEIHQFFVPGRNGTFIDCIIDSVGAFCGILLGLLLICRSSLFKKD